MYPVCPWGRTPPGQKMDPIRRKVVKELKQENVEDEVIKSIIHPLLSEEQMFRKKYAYQDMNTIGGTIALVRMLIFISLSCRGRREFSCIAT